MQKWSTRSLKHCVFVYMYEITLNSLNFFNTSGVPMFRFAKLSIRHVGWNVFCVLMHVFIKICLLLRITNSCFSNVFVSSTYWRFGLECKLCGFPSKQAGLKLNRKKSSLCQWGLTAELPVSVSSCVQLSGTTSASCQSVQSGIC